MSLINFTNLDFDQIKQSLKDYIQSSSDFTDYDFEGSNLSTILDVLAYNTCLLYTSPSPRDRTRSRMPSSA